MAFSIVVQPNPRELRNVFAELNRYKRVGRSPRRPLTQSMLQVKRGGARRLRDRKSRWGPSRGNLARSLTGEVWDSGYRVGSNLPHAAIQQVGGDVVPKNVKALAIPMLPYLRRNQIWPRDLPRDSMHYIPVNKGNVVGLLVRATLTRSADAGKKAGAKGTKARPKEKLGELMYLLVKRVRIPGRPYLIFGNEEEAFLMRALITEYQSGRGG